MKRILCFFIVLLFTSGIGFAEGKKIDRALEERVKQRKHGNKSGPDKVRVIIQTSGDPDTSGVSEAMEKAGGKKDQKFEMFNGVAGELSVDEIEKLSQHPGVTRMSEDSMVKSHGAENTFDVAAFINSLDPSRTSTGAPEAWFKHSVAGMSVGVAVLDSGVADVSDLPNVKKIVDFVNSKNGKISATDPFGHGTHVAGIIGGVGNGATYKYLGISPQVNVVNVRVLDQNGQGYTSKVIAAIEWVIKNRNITGTDRKPLNIRVINLSLGKPPTESAETDPLAIACRKAVQAGIVVVTSAGNFGKDEQSNKTLYGGITSPGIEPSVITVGAMNTQATANRVDDTVASFSSRGPTIDGYIKPDIMAPGSNVISAMSPGNNLSKKYPQLVLDSSYMKLSGTSMAAPFVSAAAAMILQKNPNLTPNAVKAILMYTAERINKNPLDVGAGYINVLGALNLASNINASTPTGQYWLVNAGLNLTHADSINGYTAVWGNTIVWAESLYTGDLLNYNQSVWSNTIVWGESMTSWANTIVWETGISALNGILHGQTIVWEALTIVWAEHWADQW